jgi:hypothetical protein
MFWKEGRHFAEKRDHCDLMNLLEYSGKRAKLGRAIFRAGKWLLYALLPKAR